MVTDGALMRGNGTCTRMSERVQLTRNFLNGSQPRVTHNALSICAGHHLEVAEDSD
jgi:hypothetical protein